MLKTELYTVCYLLAAHGYIAKNGYLDNHTVPQMAEHMYNHVDAYLSHNTPPEEEQS